MMEFRCRTKRSEEWVDKYKGSMVNPQMIAVKLEGEARVLKPNGKPLLVYLPGAAKAEGDAHYAEFSRIRNVTDNRGYAAGGDRVERAGGGRTRKSAPNVMSSILGSFEAVGGNQYCRLTAFTASHDNEWRSLMPYFERIAALFEEHVPDRFAAQMRVVEGTNPDWVVPGTPFSTITVNNTYPTGIHTDKGDLDEGFSTLGVIRRGRYDGGWLTFPQYGVAVDMKDGDVLLMDAHEWHGNTVMTCSFCGETLRKPGHSCPDVNLAPRGERVYPERVSVVSYFRTKITTCSSAAEENARRVALQDGRNARKLGLEG